MNPINWAERYREYIQSLSPVVYWPLDDVSGLPRDISGNGRDMTAVSGSPTYLATGNPVETPAVDYPSTAFHERAAVSTAVNNMSFAFMVRRSGNTSGDLFRHGTTSGGFELEFTTTGGVLRGNLPGVGTLSTFTTMADVTWYQMVVMRNANTWQAYVNGALASASFGTAAPGAVVGNTRIIGGAASGIRWAHAAFFDTVLSLAQIETLYQLSQKLAYPVARG